MFTVYIQKIGKMRVDEDVEKLEYLSTVSGDIIWYS